MNRLATIGGGGIALLILSTLSHPAAAESECSGDGCPVLMTQTITQDFIQNRVTRGATTTPDSRIQSRLYDKAWDANANGAAPFSATPGDSVTEFGTSFSQWGSWFAKNDADKINAAKELVRKGQKLPAPVTIDRQVDLWTQTRVSNEPASQAFTSYVGADYKPLHGIVVGGMVQFDTAETGSAAAGASASGQGYMAGPYIAWKLGSNVTFDAKAAWGQANDAINAGSAHSRFVTERQLAQARLKADWNLSNWQLTPSATLESVSETATLGTGQAQAGAEVSRVSVGPKLSRQFHVGNDKSVEPFLHMNSSLDLDTAEAVIQGQAAEGKEAQNTVGAGIAISQTDEFTLRATADMDNPGSGDEKNVRTGVKLTIPLD